MFANVKKTIEARKKQPSQLTENNVEDPSNMINGSHNDMESINNAIREEEIVVESDSFGNRNL